MAETAVVVAVRRPAGPDPDPAAERPLREAAAAGDAAAFGQLARANWLAVFRYCRSRTRGWPPHVAEDLTQQTLLRAWQRIRAGGYQATGAAFAGWLVIIARNLVIDWSKSAATRLDVRVDAVDVVVAADAVAHERPPAAGAADPAELAVDGEVAGLLRAAVARLAPLQRRAVQARFYEDLSIAETAQRLGVTEAAVKALTFRATLALGRQPRVRALRDGVPKVDLLAPRAAGREAVAGG